MSTPLPSRRALLGAAAALPLAVLPVAATAAPTDDAELLHLCARFHRQHAVAHAVPADDDDAHRMALAARWGTADLIRDMRPTTAAGHRAKAGVALVLLDENSCAGGGSVDSDVDFARATLADLSGAAVTLPVVAATASLAGDDAEILRLYAEFEPRARRYWKLDRRYADVFPDPDDVREEQRAIGHLNRTLAERIADLRATSLAALRAKAFVLSAYIGHTWEGDPLWSNHDELLGWSITRDLCGDAAVDPDRRFA